ncbi:MAG TPA: hypothetical protein VFX02_04715 [Gammaproteobacteria bacterium]|nr:hypothetical protein [Gammaproteobacteria bacterium]
MGVIGSSQGRLLSGDIEHVFLLRLALIGFSGLALLVAATPASARPSWASDASCSPNCTAPAAPPAPTIPSSPDTDGTYNVSTTDSTGTNTYGWIEWDTTPVTTPVQYSNPTSGTTAVLALSNKPTGSYLYKAKACIGNNGGQVCSSWSAFSSAVYVLRTPGDPTLDAATSGVCGSLSVSWSPGSTGYPGAAGTKLYDLEESTNGGGTWSAVSGRTATTLTSWIHPSPANGITYQYRVRAWYTWSGYSSLITGWITDSVAYSCPPTPTAPVLSYTINDAHYVVADWDEPAVGMRYELERYNVTTPVSWTQIYNNTTSIYTDTTANLLTSVYEYRVRTCNAQSICSVWSNTVHVDMHPAVSLGYQYDALGRLRKVVQDGAVKTGYCYDDAGNRTIVTANGGGDDCTVVPPPPVPPGVPTGLSMSLHSGNGYTGYWAPVNGATYYDLRADKFDISYPGDPSIYPTVQGGSSSSYSAPPGYWPVWIRACSTATNSCSAKAYF